jgi:glycerol-3-phosphate acyltransferase PlsY
MNPLIALLALVVGYLCGSISFARLVGRVVAPQEDVTKTEFAVPGSEEKLEMTSVSATSVSMHVGAGFGCLTSVMDMLKVTIPTLAFRIWYPESPYFLIAAAMGVAGHNWPLYHRFIGGRGFSAVFGGMFVIDWIAVFATSLFGMLLGLLVFRDVLVAYMAGLWLMIPWLWFRTHDAGHLAYGIAVNIMFMMAMLPEIKQYIRLKREGKVTLSTAMQSSDMGRGILKIASRIGLLEDRLNDNDEKR